MRTVRHHDRETAYRRTDFETEKPPILYVHGSGGTHDVWVYQYGRRTSNRPAVALDLSGHGESDDVDTTPGYETLDAYADDVVAVAQETGADVLVGNSLGGAVVLHVAIERGVRPAAIVLCGTGAKLGVADSLLDALTDDFEGAVESMHAPDLFFHAPDEETTGASKAAVYEAGQRVTRRDFLTCDAFDVRDRLDEVDAPCLALTGEHDRLTPVSFHEYLAKNISRCEQVTIPDAAHLSMLEQSDRWNEAVEEFLCGLSD